MRTRIYTNYSLFIFVFLLVATFTMMGCKHPKQPIHVEIVDWKNKHIDSLEILYFPNSREIKEYDYRFSHNQRLIQALKKNFNTDPIQINVESFQYKLYLFSNGEPYKTIYLNIEKGNSFLSYIVNGRKIYHELNDELKLALQE